MSRSSRLSGSTLFWFIERKKLIFSVKFLWMILLGVNGRYLSGQKMFQKVLRKRNSSRLTRPCFTTFSETQLGRKTFLSRSESLGRVKYELGKILSFVVAALLCGAVMVSTDLRLLDGIRHWSKVSGRGILSDNSLTLQTHCLTTCAYHSFT